MHEERDSVPSAPRPEEVMQVEEEVVPEAVSVPNASLETEMAVPAIARFVRRYPGLREAVIGVLVAGRALAR